MAEDPKRFLREVKAGIGDAVRVDGTETLMFEDAQGDMCELKVHDGKELLILESASGLMTLSPGMAKRLANSLERWAIAGSLGHA